MIDLVLLSDYYKEIMVGCGVFVNEFKNVGCVIVYLFIGVVNGKVFWIGRNVFIEMEDVIFRL